MSGYSRSCKRAGSSILLAAQCAAALSMMPASAPSCSPALAPVDDASFAAAKSRVETALGFVKSLTREQIDGSENKVIAWKSGDNDRRMKGNDYLQQFALPNFYFFVTTAYDILRHRGVPLEKRDFLGPVNWL